MYTQDVWIIGSFEVGLLNVWEILTVINKLWEFDVLGHPAYSEFLMFCPLAPLILSNVIGEYRSVFVIATLASHSQSICNNMYIDLLLCLVCVL